LSTNIAKPRDRLAYRAALYQAQKGNSYSKLSGGVERSDKINVARPCPPSRSPQEQKFSWLKRKSIAVWSEAQVATKTNEKAVRQQDGLFFQGRIVPTEFEKDHQNFLAKSYWPAKGSVKEFFENRYLCFQQLNNLINMSLRMTKNVIQGLPCAVSSSFSVTYRPV
jgi:hypothetical protein